MSLDYYISAHDDPPPPMRGGQPEPKGRPMGSLAEVRAALDALLPGIDWSDPVWGRVESAEGGVIEVNVGDDDPCTGFAFHISGPGIESEALLARLRAAHPDWYVHYAVLGEWGHHL